MTDWQGALAELSTAVDEEFGTVAVNFHPMKAGSGPQSKKIADPDRQQVDGVCVVWSERDMTSDTFRNKPRGEQFKAQGTDVSKMNIIVSFDCRTLAVVRQGDEFERNGHRYEVVNPRPDGAMRTRADVVKVA